MAPLPNCNWRKQISWLFLSLACYASVLCPVLLGDVSGCANTIPTNLVQAACLRGTQRSALLGVLFVVSGRVGVKDPAAPNDLNLVAPLAVFSNHDRFGFRVHGFRNSDRRIPQGAWRQSQRPEVLPSLGYNPSLRRVEGLDFLPGQRCLGLLMG